MKRMLLALLFIPAMCHAQVAEVSLKGGVITNKMMRDIVKTDITNPVGYAGSLAVTLGLPAGFRIGLAASVYDVKATITGKRIDANGAVIGEYDRDISYGDPLIPIELLLIKRFNAGRIRIDIGGMAGVCLNKKIVLTSDDVPQMNDVTVDKTNKWLTYGGLIGFQYRLGCRTAIGLEAQPKMLDLAFYKNASFAMPVMLKYCISL